MIDRSFELVVNAETLDEEFIRALAYHEAGHAIVAWSLKVPLKELKIGGRGGVCVNSLIVSPLLDPETMDQRDWRQIENRGLILLGGETAELIGSEMADLAGDKASAELFRDAYSTSTESVVPGSDREELKELAQLVFGNLGPTATSWTRKLEDRAQEIVIEHWDKICRLASALILMRILSGPEATRIIQEVSA